MGTSLRIQRPTGRTDQSTAAPPPGIAAGVRPRGLRLHLVGMILAALLPTLGFGAAACWFALRTEGAATEARLAGKAATLAALVDRDLAARRAALEVLASSLTLGAGDSLATLDALARGVDAAFGGWVLVLDRSLRLVAHTGIPPGEELPAFAGGLGPGGGGVAMARVFETGQATISDLAVGRISGRLSAILYVPATRDGVVRYAVGMLLMPEQLSRLLQAEAGPSEDGIAVTDRRGIVVASSQGQDRPVDQQRIAGGAPEPREEAGPLPGRPWLRGQSRRVAQHRLDAAPGWTVWVSEPPAARQGWLDPMPALLGGGLLALGFGLALAIGLSRRVLRPVHALVRHAEAIAAGEPTDETPAPAAAVAEFEALRLAGLRAEAALRQGDARLRLALTAAGFGSFEVDLRSRTATRTGHVLPSRPDLPLVGFSLDRYFAETVHPEDGDRVRAAVETVARGEAPTYRVEYRVRDGRDGWIWLESHGGVVDRDAASGAPLRIVGVTRDVTERKAAESRQLLLMREVDHRAKNALAVVQAAVRLAPKEDAAAFARAVEGRVAALARAQGLLAETGWAGTSLRLLAERCLAAFLPTGPAAGTPGAPICLLAGPPVDLAASATQPLSLALHELATNAVKYGALSAAGGEVHLSWQPDPEAGLLRLRWEERGGPPIRSPARRGFGSRVIQASIADQLHGRVAEAWEPTGLVCDMTLPLLPVLARAEDGVT